MQKVALRWPALTMRQCSADSFSGRPEVEGAGKEAGSGTGAAGTAGGPGATRARLSVTCFSGRGGWTGWRTGSGPGVGSFSERGGR